MAKAALNSVIRRVVSAQARGGPPDRHLLERFLAHKDEAAFAALVERHGAMVLAVAHSVLHHLQDAEDVFQATFLVLARQAGSIRKLDSAGSWLHGVAYRLARKARTAAAAKRRREISAPVRTSAELSDDLTWCELSGILNEELERLPEKYRAPLVLCYLEGMTQDQASQHLGLAKGALKGRLERARLLLRGRLRRRGLAPAVVLLADTYRPVGAALSVNLASTTARMATAFAVGRGVGISAPVVELMEGALKAMFVSKLRWTATLLLVASLTVTSTGMLVSRGVLWGSAATAEPEMAKVPAVAREEAAAKPGRPANLNLLDRTSAPELAKFEGTWILVSSERNGQTTSEEKNPFTLTFTGDKWKVHRGDEAAVEGTLRLVDVAATPKKFDLIKTSRLAPGTSVDYGIYEWKGDTLRYCTRNGPLGSGLGVPDLRPRDFTTRDGDGRTVYLWKRAHPAAKAPVEQPAWGKPLKGLRLGLYPADPKGDGKPRLIVVLDNVRNEDLVLNLGAMFGFGKKQVPQAIRFVFTDSEGKKHTLLRRIGKIDERLGALVIPLVLPLSAGGRYTISCDPADYFDAADGEAALTAGCYRVRAEFVGRAVTKQETGEGSMSYLASMPYWTGTIQSEDIQVTMPAKPAK